MIPCLFQLRDFKADVPKEGTENQDRSEASSDSSGSGDATPKQPTRAGVKRLNSSAGMCFLAIISRLISMVTEL